MYHSIPSGNAALMGYLTYWNGTAVIELSKNQRVSSTDHQKFRDFSIRLRNGDNTFKGGALLSNCNVSKFNAGSINTTPVRITYSNQLQQRTIILCWYDWINQCIK